MTEKAGDRRLSRETRRSLVFSLVVEALHALREGREPAVQFIRVQQMLRSIDDELRAGAAAILPQYIQEMSSAQRGSKKFSKGEIFKLAVGPFLQKVWPQERSLATPGVSEALSRLPAESGQEFSQAVSGVSPYLVPFDCWSLYDYGVDLQEGPTKNLANIDTEPKALAFAQLLDLTVGKSEGAVVPHDLAEGLDILRSSWPRVAVTAEFKRLAAAARR